MSRRAKKLAQSVGQEKEVAVSDENQGDETVADEALFDPTEHSVAEVKEELADASEEERLRIAAAEQAGDGRKTVLAAAGVDSDVRLDASGRRLNGWEVAPK